MQNNYADVRSFVLANESNRTSTFEVFSGEDLDLTVQTARLRSFTDTPVPRLDRDARTSLSPH